MAKKTYLGVKSPNALNLFDGELIKGYINADTGVLNTSSPYQRCAVSKNFIPVYGRSVITVSNDMGYYCYIHEYDANYTFIQTQKSTTSSFTATLHENTRYIKIRSDYTLTQNDLSVKYSVVLMPAKYKAILSYLETTGTQWIDTGIILDPEKFEYEVKFEISTNTGATQTFSNAFTTWNTSNQLSSVGASTYSIGYILSTLYGGGVSSNTGINVGWSYGTIIEMSLHGSELTYNGTPYVMERPNGGTKPSGTQPIFALRTGASSISERVTGKCWYYRIWADSNTLVRDFIPVLDWNDVPCMYDRVSDTLFYNQGTGDFGYQPMLQQVLPSEYEPTPYLQSDSSAYIDTGVSGNNDNLAIGITFSVDKYVTYGAIYGNYVSDSHNGVRLIFAEDVYNDFAFLSNLNTVCTTRGNTIAELSNAVGGISRFYRDASSFRINDAMYTDVSTIKGAVNNNNIALFNRSVHNPNTSRDIGLKIYNCTMYDNGVLIRYFIPCYRKVDMVAGMYDLVSQKFFTSVGSGTFKFISYHVAKRVKKLYIGIDKRVDAPAHPNITDSGYREVEYLESNGAQYINTGVIASNTIITEVKCQSFAGNKAIVASGNSAGMRYQIYCSTSLLFSTSFADGYSGLGDPSATEIATIRLDPVAKKSTYNGIEFPLNYTDSVQARSLWLFGRNQASSPNNYLSTTKMWYCKMWDGDTLIRHYVPCVRISDGEAGMYDLVTNAFFANSGTSRPFIAGAFCETARRIKKAYIGDPNGLARLCYTGKHDTHQYFIPVNSTGLITADEKTFMSKR